MSIQLLLNRMHFTHRIPHNPFLMYILFTSYSQNCQAFWHNVIYSFETFDPHLSKFKLHPVMMSHQIQKMAGNSNFKIASWYDVTSNSNFGGKFKFQITSWYDITSNSNFWREFQIQITSWYCIIKFLAGNSNSNCILVLHDQIFGGKFKF